MKKQQQEGTWLMPRALPFMVAHWYGRLIRPLPVGHPPPLTLRLPR